MGYSATAIYDGEGVIEDVTLHSKGCWASIRDAADAVHAGHPTAECRDLSESEEIAATIEAAILFDFPPGLITTHDCGGKAKHLLRVNSIGARIMDTGSSRYILCDRCGTWNETVKTACRRCDGALWVAVTARVEGLHKRLKEGGVEDGMKRQIKERLVEIAASREVNQREVQNAK
jgi:hypothetical protein